MVIICIEEISKLRKLEEADTGGSQGAQQRGSVNVSVVDDVVAVFKGKTVCSLHYSLNVSSQPLFIILLSLPLLLSIQSPLPPQHHQLLVLEEQINSKVHSSDPGTDVGYWESLLQQLKAFMARVS